MAAITAIMMMDITTMDMDIVMAGVGITKEATMKACTVGTTAAVADRINTKRFTFLGSRAVFPGVHGQCRVDCAV